ncbi:hypothetical protein MPSEU_000767300 [Mayamaea pseudoterrestris]|nr:hypothetical protein MPSEU_000767300 [Mayamaea pseudoterrestris]
MALTTLPVVPIRSTRRWLLVFVLFSIVFHFSFFLSVRIITKDHYTFYATYQRETTLQQHDSYNACFAINSPEWLLGERLGNLRDLSLFDMDILPSPLPSHLRKQQHSRNSFTAGSHYLQNLLDQSICADESRFRNLKDGQELFAAKDDAATFDAALLKQWTIRLVYWSMHYHQTRHARAEARHRQKQLARNIDCHASSVGPYDYECPDAKYIVIGLYSPVGLGAQLRLGMVNGYLHALIADRIVVWVNDSPVGSQEYLQVPWALVSCDNNNSHDNTTRTRRDTQCFFQPGTPCVLTVNDVDQAYNLTDREIDQLYDSGIHPAGHEHDKVWHIKLFHRPQGHTPALAAQRLRNHSYTLIQEHFSSPDVNPHFQKLLYQAADNILTPDPWRVGHDYPAAHVKAHHALVVYAMRPRRDKARQMKELLNSLKATNAIDPQFSMGLPVRASDKCEGESECLSFQEHIQATHLVWDKFSQFQQRPSSITPSLLFTTESTAMVREQRNFSDSHPNFTFRIASNIHDVTPDSGLSTQVSSNISRDDSLLSAITTLQFQLLARVTLANCCSNFHILLGDLLSAGCGAAPVNDFQCFLELEDPNLWMCCEWLDSCANDKRAAIKKWNANSNSSASL